MSSTVNLNVDLDVVLCVLAQALLAAFRNRLGPGYATATITVVLNRRAYSPVLRQAAVGPETNGSDMIIEAIGA